MWHDTETGRAERSNAGSELAVLDEQPMVNGTPDMPNIANLSVTRSSRVHFGPKIVNVTQTVHTSEVVKDLPLSTYLCNFLKSTTRAERLSCVASLVALVICIGLIAYYSSSGKNIEADTVDVAPHEWNITKEMWLGQAYNYTETTQQFEPIRLVIIQHTVSPECHKFVRCAAELRNIQGWYLRDHEYDIPYNFLVGNDGRIYEGRGWGIVGAHTRFYNRCSLGLGFIGDYREKGGVQHTKVTQLQINRTLMFLETSVEQGLLDPDYVVLAAKDLQSTESPGANLYKAMQQWRHFNNGSEYKNKTCEAIWAMRGE
ncbi:peptidoglycan recognition protein-like isoform X1 [Achroia grisella]|uniref:peptidoglycan recognition protein-like isoform X1 n=1 Tax=Achroia grisella TaxID=688607 RepID=UPI0027D2FA11|nr:peptidoglycan recognition protein-like isoform X1 [Achroia grisella]